jgi:prevent-host-death family protein
MAQSMRTVGAYELKTHASELLDAAERGESITVTRRGVPVARLIPLEQPDKRAANSVANWRLRRRRIRPLSNKEILSLRDEGRRIQ